MSNVPACPCSSTKPNSRDGPELRWRTAQKSGFGAFIFGGWYALGTGFCCRWGRSDLPGCSSRPLQRRGRGVWVRESAWKCNAANDGRGACRNLPAPGVRFGANGSAGSWNPGAGAKGEEGNGVRAGGAAQEGLRGGAETSGEGRADGPDAPGRPLFAGKSLSADE